MKTFIKYSLLCFFVTGMLNSAFSQTFEEFKKQERDELRQFRIQQDKAIRKLQSEYNAYVQQADREFAGFLKNQWGDYNAWRGIEVPEKPKPVEIPKYEPGSINQLFARKISVEVTGKEGKIPAIKPVLPVIQKTEPEGYLKSDIRVDYYGTPLTFRFDESLLFKKIQRISEQAVGDWWAACSKTNYNSLVNELLNTKNTLSLNDWAYFMLVKKTAAAISGNDNNNAGLLTWFLMIRSGYNVKIAFHNNNIYLLIPSLNQLYGKNYLLINNQRFYFVDDVSFDSFQTYDFNFPGATRVIDFNIYQPMNIGNDVSQKQVRFNYGGKDYSFPVTLNVNSLYFLRDYPVTELNVFFNAAMSRVTKESLADGIIPLIQNMSTNDAVNFLLAFVQKSFVYKTDQEQFGKEKFFFPEELFYYAASDCEDRAALFTYLVRQLLHLEVIGLEYQGHVATAISPIRNAQGDFLYFNNTKYAIADPTYINAPLGLIMPQYKNKKPKVIEVSNTSYLANRTRQYWDLTNQWGGYRGSNLADACFDSHGNCYLAGYYAQKVQFGNTNWMPPKGKRQAFIAKYNNNKQLEWAKNITCDHAATAFSITLDDAENPVIAGSFRGEARAEGRQLTTKDNREDIFIAAYNKGGSLLWLRKSGLDTVTHNQFLNYVIHLNNSGKQINTRLYFENEASTSNGIYYEGHSITVIGSINNTIGFNVEQLSFNEEYDFNIVDYLKKENDALIKKQVNKNIAGLFAAMNLIKTNGIVIAGKDVQDALNKYNPRFRSSSPELYDNIGKLSFMKNNDGIIIIKTKHNSLSFDKVKISDGARIKITSFQNGNKQIDILSGIEVGKLFIWYNLNFVRLMRSTGDMLFDYDSDHTQKTLNIKEDILD